MAISTHYPLTREPRQSLAHEVTDSALADRYPMRPLSPEAQRRKDDVEARLAAAIVEQRKPCADGRTRANRIETYLNLESTWQAWNRLGWELNGG